MVTLQQTLRQTHDWALSRVETLTDEHSEEDAFSIVQEFSEWLDPENDNHDVYSLEYIGEGSEYD